MHAALIRWKDVSKSRTFDRLTEDRRRPGMSQCHLVLKVKSHDHQPKVHPKKYKVPASTWQPLVEVIQPKRPNPVCNAPHPESP